MIIDNKYTIRHKVLTGNIDGKCRATPMEFAVLMQELAALQQCRAFHPAFAKNGLNMGYHKAAF